METNQKRKFSAEFKSKVVIEALKERHTIEELARKYELHPTQISLWKKEFLEKASSIFTSAVQRKDANLEQEKVLDKLYSQIGQQKVEIDWLKKKLQ